MQRSYSSIILVKFGPLNNTKKLSSELFFQIKKYIQKENNWND